MFDDFTANKKAEMQNLTFQQIQVLGFNEIGQQLLKANKGKKSLRNFINWPPLTKTLKQKRSHCTIVL